MALSTKLELRQGQQLVMTPQLQQAIRLLQLSNIELMQYVETELERKKLTELGCELLQGHLFARPGPAFPKLNGYDFGAGHA